MTKKILSIWSIISYKKNAKKTIHIAYVLIYVAIITLVAINRLSSFIWLFLGITLILLFIINIIYSHNTVSLLIFTVSFQILVRLPLLIKSTMFLYEIDEYYHFGLAILYAFYPSKEILIRMRGYDSYPIMDQITSIMLKIFGINYTIIIIKLIYGVIMPSLTVIFVYKILKEINSSFKDIKIQMILFVFCYKFLYFISFYIYETVTFFSFSILLWLFLRRINLKKESVPRIGKSNKLIYNSISILFICLLMNSFHYDSNFLCISLIVFYFFTTIYNSKNINSYKVFYIRESIFGFLYFIALNIRLIFYSKSRGKFIGLYRALFSIVNINLPYNYNKAQQYIAIFQIYLILFIGFIIGVYITRKILLKLTSYINLLFKEKVRSDNFMIFVFFGMIFISLIVGYIVKKFWEIGSAYRTISNYHFFTLLGFAGIIMFFVLTIFSLSRKFDDIKINLFCIYIIFSLLVVFSFVYPMKTNKTLSYRIFPYSNLLGIYFVSIGLNNITMWLDDGKFTGDKNLNQNTSSNHLLKLQKFLNFYKIQKCYKKNRKIISILIVLFLIGLQSISMARWEGHTPEFKLPETDIIEMSDWLRENFTEKKIFIEFILRPIAAYGFIETPRNLEEDLILLSLYYKRNITEVKFLLKNDNINYLIFDSSGQEPGYMTKIGRDHYLLADGFDKDILENYNSTVPIEFDIIFRTRFLFLLKIT